MCTGVAKLKTERERERDRLTDRARESEAEAQKHVPAVPAHSAVAKKLVIIKQPGTGSSSPKPRAPSRKQVLNHVIEA